MAGIEEALDNLFPVGWLDPYGQMPLNKDRAVQIDITQVKTDDGIKVTAVKTPPRAGTTSIQDAISMALGMGCCGNEAPESSPQSADQGKREKEKEPGNDWKQGDKVENLPKQPDSGQYDDDEDGDEKEKAPK